MRKKGGVAITNQYTTTSITGFNSDPPTDAGATDAENEVEWQKHLDKLALPVKNRTDDMDANIFSAFGKTINTDAGEQGIISGVVGHGVSALTLVGGSITPVKNIHSVRGQSGAADNLAAIATGSVPDGTILYIHAGSDSEVITVKHEDSGESGNLHLAGRADIVLDSTKKHLVFRRNGSDWYEIGSGADFVDGNTTLSASGIDYANDRIGIWDADADEWKNAAPKELGAMQLLETIIAASDTTIGFLNIDTGFTHFRIKFSDVKTNASGSILFKFGDSGGILSTVYNWTATGRTSSSAIDATGTNAAAFDLTATISVSSTAKETVNGWVDFDGINLDRQSSATWHVGGANSASAGFHVVGGGLHNADATITQVQFSTNATDFSQGVFSLYGLRS